MTHDAVPALPAACDDSCESYDPGHRVHFIQARLSWQPDVVVLPALVLENDRDGFLVVETTDDHRRYLLWNHGRGRLRTPAGGTVRYRPRHHVLDLGPEPGQDPRWSTLANVTALELR